MPVWQRVIFCFCGIFGCLAVMLAALGAHLPDQAFIPGGRPMLSRGVEMLMWHVLALLGLGVSGIAALRWVALPMAAGTVLFTLPVVSLALKGPNVAFLAPFGGTLTMLAWLSLAVLACFAHRFRRSMT
ncbi:DUF423 domain-containing protein [Asaia siamensis]|nr:DUF423 domain-containing protein [Asaia siamensis]